MSTLKEKAEQILQEKDTKISLGEFPDTTTIFGINGTLGDERDRNIDSMEFPQISDAPAEECVIITSNPNNDNIIVNSMTNIESRVGYSELAQEIGLSDDILKEGNVVLGINGTYGGAGQLIIPIDYNSQEFVVYCGVIADILDTGLSTYQKNDWVCCNTSSGLSRCCVKLCNVVRTDSIAFDSFCDGYIGIAIDGIDEELKLVYVTDDYISALCNIDTNSSSQYYSSYMKYSDLINLLREVGTVAAQADVEVSFSIYNDFSHIYFRNLQGTTDRVGKIDTNQLYFEVRDI